jgi:hypothetical protein
MFLLKVLLGRLLQVLSISRVLSVESLHFHSISLALYTLAFSSLLTLSLALSSATVHLVGNFSTFHSIPQYLASLVQYQSGVQTQKGVVFETSEQLFFE